MLLNHQLLFACSNKGMRVLVHLGLIWLSPSKRHHGVPMHEDGGTNILPHPLSVIPLSTRIHRIESLCFVTCYQFFCHMLPIFGGYLLTELKYPAASVTDTPFGDVEDESSHKDHIRYLKQLCNNYTKNAISTRTLMKRTYKKKTRYYKYIEYSIKHRRKTIFN